MEQKINYQPEVVMQLSNLLASFTCAIKLSFIHPTTNEVLSFKTRMADDMRNLLAALSFNEQLDTRRLG